MIALPLLLLLALCAPSLCFVSRASPSELHSLLAVRRPLDDGTATGDQPYSRPVKATRPVRSSARTSGGSGGKRVMNQGAAREKEISNPNRLRIIAGTAKVKNTSATRLFYLIPPSPPPLSQGKKIDSPDVYLRPMMGKVREALFSSLAYMGLFEPNAGTRVLDMFAGSGSVGLEALSRGAVHATFVDFSSVCTAQALTNAVHCGFEKDAVQAVCARAEDVLDNPTAHGLLQPYGLVTITPPYEEVIYAQLLKSLCSTPLVTDDTIVVVEYPVELGTLPQVVGGDRLFGIRNRRYGRTVLAIYVCRPTKQYDMRPEEFL